jgi:hypothetical protein
VPKVSERGSDRLDHREQQRVDDQYPRPTVIQQVFVVVRSEQGVDRYRYRADLDCAEERIRKFRAVVEKKQYSLLWTEIEAAQRVPGLVDAGQQFAIGDVAIGYSVDDRDRCSATQPDVQVNERIGGVHTGRDHEIRNVGHCARSCVADENWRRLTEPDEHRQPNRRPT